MRVAARPAVFVLAALLPACVVLDTTGPDEVEGGFPFVEGLWQIDAFVQSSSCGLMDDEPFLARVFQNRDILQIAVDISGFGQVRYDGFLQRDGDFRVSHATVFPDQGIRDEATVQGEFGSRGLTMSATETEVLTDLVTGRRCTIVWRWRGDRR